VRRAQHEASLTPRDDVSVISSTAGFQPIPSPVSSRQPTSYHVPDTVDEHLARLPIGIILKALNIFTAKFPELRILQASAFIKEYQTARSKESKALLATILAITRKQCSIVTGDWLRSLKSSECYASYAWSTLADAILQPPKVQVVQALLILTLYEWGVREYHKAWMHCGKLTAIANENYTDVMKESQFASCSHFTAPESALIRSTCLKTTTQTSWP
jgi:hypothetical protein